MKRKEYEIEDTELPVLEEPAEPFVRRSDSHAAPKSRTTVDEYFSEVRRILYKKYEDLQN